MRTIIGRCTPDFKPVESHTNRKMVSNDCNRGSVKLEYRTNTGHNSKRINE